MGQYKGDWRGQGSPHPTGNSHTRPTPPEDGYLTERELARLLNVSPRTLQGWRLRGNGPPFCAFSERCIRYLWSDAAEWARSRRRRSTSDAPSEDRS